SGASSGTVRFAGSVRIPHMQRREFVIIVVGGVIVPSLPWPRLAHAQAKVLKIGYLDAGAQRDATTQYLRRQFLLGLRDLGILEGRDVQMEDRFAEGRLERLPALAAELASIPAEIIVCGGEAVIR